MRIGNVLMNANMHYDADSEWLSVQWILSIKNVCTILK